jgi:16S rRNA (cytosine1402-N4)-methyltransferase
MMEYHIPVLARECIDGLNIREDGVYADVTFGGGGHSRLILEKLGDKGHLYGMDRDDTAADNRLNDPRFTWISHNFKYLKRFMRYHGVKQLDGILADLGVSSHQFDTDIRGFSHRFSGPLDMRMNQYAGITAADILNEYHEEDLVQVLSKYGEVRNSKSLAKRIVDDRKMKKFKSTDDLVQLCLSMAIGHKPRYLAQVFQAFRIEVNGEMIALGQFLEQSLDLLASGGRLVVISYHSLEDRMVKQFIKTGNLKGELIRDEFGKILKPFREINKDVITPSDVELADNSRSRSAKLRIGEKI